MDCSIAMLAGPDDAGHVRLLFNHADRTSGFTFRHRALTIDTLPSVRFPAGHSGTAALKHAAREMLAAGEIDAIYETATSYVDVELKHFGHRLKRRRDFRGIPLLGWAIGIERAPTDYVCHFDCDILMHSADGYSWVAAAIEALDSKLDVMFVAPRGGPGGAHNKPTKVRTFSSRRFVVDRRRLRAILPLPKTHRSWKRRLLMGAGGASSYWPWETHVQAAVSNSPFSCLYLGDPRAWWIHSPDHGDAWKRILPKIAAACEQGIYPEEQVGSGDLNLSAWQALHHESTKRSAAPAASHAIV